MNFDNNIRVDTLTVSLLTDYNAPLDIKYGPYNSLNEAKALLTGPSNNGSTEVSGTRYQGLTVGIYAYDVDKKVFTRLPEGYEHATPTSIVEYWFKDGIEDDDLVEKLPDVSGLPAGIKVVKFKSNGGSGHMNSLLTDEEGYVELPVNKFTHIERDFNGWSTNKDAMNGDLPEAMIHVDGDCTMYAIWSTTVNNYTFYYYIVSESNNNPSRAEDYTSVESNTTNGFYANGLGYKTYVLIPNDINVTSVKARWLTEITELGQQEVVFTETGNEIKSGYKTFVSDVITVCLQDSIVIYIEN